jgi:hypothetical protein
VAPTYGLCDRGIEKREDVLDALCMSENVFDAREAARFGVDEVTSRSPKGWYEIEGGSVEAAGAGSGLIGRLMLGAVCTEELAVEGDWSFSVSIGEMS